MRKEVEEEVNKLKSQLGQYSDSGTGGDDEILKLQKALEDKVHKKKKLEEEIIILRSQMLQLTFEADQGGKVYKELNQAQLSPGTKESSKVLLFDDFMAKIADFNLTNQSSDTTARLHLTRVLGTFGYHAPE
ncbi:hypothetical protein REPUB_Repub11eG0059700 [Reevesia pubescens]